MIFVSSLKNKTKNPEKTKQRTGLTVRHHQIQQEENSLTRQFLRNKAKLKNTILEEQKAINILSMIQFDFDKAQQRDRVEGPYEMLQDVIADELNSRINGAI